MKVLHVLYEGRAESVEVGRLVLRDRVIFFEYSKSFLDTRLELSPLKLPLKPGVFQGDSRVFDGLWGVFNDSLPDGFGRLLLDRKLMQLGKDPKSLTPLDRLAYVGSRGMGALSYRPAEDMDETVLRPDLDVIAGYYREFQVSGDPNHIDELLALNGSSQGARPKLLVRLGDEGDWLIKFASSSDPINIGAIEYDYHLMAVEAGLDVPEARLFPSKKCPGYFGVKRFDRSGNSRIHMHTACGLLDADFRIPSLDYEQLIKATLWLTKDIREAEKLFRQAAFNVFAKNRDDHAKNFSFLMDSNGKWRLSPAYDLVYSSGPMGEHSTTVMGEGKNPGSEHLIRLAQVAGLESSRAKDILEQVRAACSKALTPPY
jgi:serine/threonine-protein kinase HipA